MVEVLFYKHFSAVSWKVCTWFIQSSRHIEVGTIIIYSEKEDPKKVRFRESQQCRFNTFTVCKEQKVWSKTHITSLNFASPINILYSI